MNIKQLLEYGIKLLKERNIENPSLKTKIVLSYYINKNKEYLIVHDNQEIEKQIEIKYMEAITKLCNSIPIQYIINRQEFMGLEFYVDESVLIPQPDTEILVEEVIKIFNERFKQRYTNIRFMYRKWSNRYINGKIYRKFKYYCYRYQ